MHSTRTTQTGRKRSARSARRHSLHLLVGTLACMLISAPVAIAQTLRPCSTSPTIRRASSTRTSTRRSPSTGRRRPASASTIQQSHGGSGKQARAVIDGLEADVVTLALPTTSTRSRKAGPDPLGLAEAAAAQQRALHLDHRVPGAQGQPEGHQGLGRSGEARRRGRSRRTRRPRAARAGTTWRPGATRCEQPRRQRGQGARSSSRSSIKNVPVLDSGARGSTTTFVERGIGDVLLAWENEALLAVKELGPDEVRDRRPVRQHPGRAAGRGRRQERRRARARARWRRPISSSSTRRGPGDHRREAPLPPRDAAVARKYASAASRDLKLFTIDEVFGGWAKAQNTHFADGGVFDQIYNPGGNE